MQIAARKCTNYRVEDGRVRADFVDMASYCLLRPGSRIPAKIVALTGITASILKANGKPLSDALHGFRSFVGPLPIVAHNAKFDCGFLNAAAEPMGLHFDNEVICTLNLARTTWPAFSSYRLTDLCAALGIETDGAHNAIADVQMTMHLFIQIRLNASKVKAEHK
jgi:DNA polymerase III epsilon subunit-like protein